MDDGFSAPSLKELGAEQLGLGPFVRSVNFPNVFLQFGLGADPDACARPVEVPNFPLLSVTTGVSLNFSISKVGAQPDVQPLSSAFLILVSQVSNFSWLVLSVAMLTHEVKDVAHVLEQAVVRPRQPVSQAHLFFGS